MNEQTTLISLWKELHELAEVSFEEVKTTEYLVNFFKKEGFNPVKFKNIPGFYVELGEGNPVVGLRADMDALMQNVDGEMKANHSCGHDAHMTIVTGVMNRLKKEESQLKGTVRAIFQPGEELGNGSIEVVKEGVADDLDYLFGVHLRPHNEMPYPNCAPGIQHGAGTFIKGEIFGEDHHGARQNEGVNAIEVGSAIVQHLKQIYTRPTIPASIKMTNFKAGSESYNIIPGEASFGLDLRAQENKVMDEIKTKLSHIINSLATLYELKIKTEIIDEVPAAIINEKAEKHLIKAITEEIGEEHLRPRLLTPGSDDFHFYTLLRPHIKATMLALGADVRPGLHDPDMTFNKIAITNGVNILTNVVRNICNVSEEVNA